jgi:hypothetical protein
VIAQAESSWHESRKAAENKELMCVDDVVDQWARRNKGDDGEVPRAHERPGENRTHIADLRLACGGGYPE